MIHFSARFHQNTNQSKSSTNNNSSAAGISDEQLTNMSAPRKINPILWDLSSTQERRTLLENSELLENSSSEMTGLTNSSGTESTSTTLSKNRYKILDFTKYTQPNQQSAVAADEAQLSQSNIQSVASLAGRSLATGDQQALTQITQQFQQRFANTASDKTAFHDIMTKTFGDQYNQSSAENIRQQTIKGDFSWMPTIEMVDSQQLQDQSGTQDGYKALGAYSQSNDTVYLSKQLLRSDLTQAEKILTEEVGHAIDTRVNVSDATGDEGDIFARQVHGEELSTETLNELKQENDSGVIEIDGEKVEVEYGLGSSLKKAFKKVKRGVKKLGRGIKKGLKKIGQGIKKGINKLGSSIKKAFKKLAQSKFFQGILTVAQFIPIPVVAMVAKGINIAMSAYNVYQGVKHKSWGAVLGGVAGLVNGVSNFGKAFGASSGFIDKLTSFTKHMNTASMAYTAIAEKDFLAAANLATNFFDGNKTFANTIKQAGQAQQVYQAVQKGDYLSAIGAGSTLMQDFTGAAGDQVLRKIGQNAEVMQSIDRAVNQGDYSSAVAILTEQYGSHLNLGGEEREKISQVTQTFQQLHQANQLIKSHQYGDAAQLLLQTAERHSGSVEAKASLYEASQNIKQLDKAVTSLKEGRFTDAINSAGDLLNRPIDETSHKLLTEIESYAKDAQKLGILIENGSAEEIIQILKDRMDKQVVITNILNHAA
ncbi:hypothetical protein A3197_18570 [Candidatus Thiodiazotropha endoloripes]|nr:hypothetical protein A3197_18570 [Candidatus Thiodiazotropha endoloripes]